MERSSNGSENQCEQRHFHCAAVATPAPPSVVLQSCAQANQSLDTVRSLHQTVVSLRNALDDARREISNLKKQMTVQTVIEEGKTFKENDPGHKPIEEEKSSSTVNSNSGPKMGSQIDVKIRVSSNLNVSTSSEMEEGKAAPDSARSVVNIKLSSQEQLNVSQQEESLYTFNQSVNEEVQLDGGNAEQEEERVSLIEEENSHSEHPLIGDGDEKSLSDGDNSVFGDSKEGGGADQDDHEEVEPAKHFRPKNTLHIPHQKLSRAHSDTQEEVDDIELIFSSDDHHRELHGEEMVSISSTFEPWQKPGSSGTPVLLSFEKFSLDEQEGSQTHQQQRRRKQISLDEGPRSVADKSLQKKISLDRDRAEDEAQQLAGTSLGNSKWQQNKKELHVTDISKCGISEENIMDMGRRNTCPNPPVYRPVLSFSQRESGPVPPRHRNPLSTNRCILGGKYTRPGGAGVRGGTVLCSSPGRSKLRSPLIAITNAGNGNETGPKRSSSVQTDISALPDHWQSESHLSGACYANGLFTLPSKFNPLAGNGGVPVGGGRLGPHCPRTPLRPSQKTQEARRVLLSDINFTSRIPELSRSADHLCPDDGGEGEEEDEEGGQENQEHDEYSHHHHHHHHLHHRQHNRGHHGQHLQTPNMSGYKKGLTPSTSIHSHGSMNENSFATQTTQTGDYWVNKGDSFDSASCYTNDSRLSLNKSINNSRSRSVPSIKCVYCKKSHGLAGMRTSESMNYTPRVVAIPESYATVKGSLPDLRHDCCCPQRYQGGSGRVYSRTYVGSTESLIDDSDVFMRHSSHSVATPVTPGAYFDYSMGSRGSNVGTVKQSRRCSENDLGRSYQPSKQSLPFLPKSANCLKIGHLAKVIARNGRVVVGQVRYVGPICNAEYVAKLDGGSHDTFIGLELPASGGDTDGTVEGKRFFYCEQNRGIFVPFPKVIMAWTS